MAILNLPLDQGHCNLKAFIGLRESAAVSLAAAGIPGPAPVAVRAMIDTGADITCIDPAIALTLGLIITGRIRTNVPHGQPDGEESDTCKVSLTIKHSGDNAADDLYRPVWTVASLPIAHIGTDVLIGNDLLDECDFHRDGPAGMFWLGY
jgi:hypothetical protein